MGGSGSRCKIETSPLDCPSDPVIVCNGAGTVVIRWFLSRKRVKQLLRTIGSAAGDDVVAVEFGAPGVRMRIELSTHHDPDAAFLKFREQLRLAFAESGGRA
jgi:hypothetical protein